MNPKNTPFTDAYVKEQSKAYKMSNISAVFGMVVVVLAPVISRFDSDVTGTESVVFVGMGLIFVMWGGVIRYRVHTFRENLELYKMIQQLPQDKDVDQ
jgi:hypothetical protein